MLRSKVVWILLIAVILVSGGGYYYYNNAYALPQESVEESVRTTTVRQGDLVISASGSGELVPAEEVALGFTSGGVLSAVSVDVGSQVEVGGWKGYTT